MRLKSVNAKLLIVVALACAFLVPLAMVRALIAERAGLRDAVIADVARSAADRQRLTLPVLVVPYVHRQVESTETVDDEGRRKVSRRDKVSAGALRFLPDSVDAQSRPELSHKYRGLYRVPTYAGPVTLRGRFRVPPGFGWQAGSVEWGTPFVAIGISDPRGIRGAPTFEWNGHRAQIRPGTGGDLSRIGAGVSAVLDAAPVAGGTLDFAFQVDLMGMERLSFIPTARESAVRLTAAWPHPSFFGRFSPDSRVEADGFAATWKSTLYASGVEQAYADCAERAKCAAFEGNEFGAAFVQPADLYQQLERSAKYGFLFVGLTFAAFFLIETLRSLALHPVQYGLVGLALALFFVLLVALSEHLGFTPAYLGAASACVALIVAYLWSALASRRAALGVGALLASLYAVLYALLRSEDHALLAGSLFLFALLAGLMLGTRKVNWYAPVASGHAAPANTMLEEGAQ